MELGFEQIVAVLLGATTSWIFAGIRATKWKVEGWIVQLIIFGIAIVFAFVAGLISKDLNLANAGTSIAFLMVTSNGIYTQLIKKLVPPKKPIV